MVAVGITVLAALNLAVSVVKLCSSAAHALGDAKANAKILKIQLYELRAACLNVQQIPDQLCAQRSGSAAEEYAEMFTASLDNAQQVMKYVTKKVPQLGTSRLAKLCWYVSEAFAGSDPARKLGAAINSINAMQEQWQRLKPQQEAVSAVRGLDHDQTSDALRMNNAQYKPPSALSSQLADLTSALLDHGKVTMNGTECKHLLLHGPSGIGKTSLTKYVVHSAKQQNGRQRAVNVQQRPISANNGQQTAEQSALAGQQPIEEARRQDVKYFFIRCVNAVNQAGHMTVLRTLLSFINQSSDAQVCPFDPQH